MHSVVGRVIGLVVLLLPAAKPALAEDAARAAVPQLAAAQNTAPTPPPVAATAPAAPAAEEPPARVGRVDLVSGNLAFHMRGEKAWSAAGLNYPVATGGSFWTDPKSRAVLRVGPSTIDMAADTELDIVNLNQQVGEFGLAKGEIRLHLRELGGGQSVAVDLAQGGLWLLQPGEYSIDAGSAGAPTRVAVLTGGARFVGNGVDIAIKAGEAALLTGANPVVAKIEHATPGEFVGWCRSHEYVENKLAAPYYVSPNMTGYEALDQYGSWASVPQYGEVWYPSVAADWLPYRDGRWVWIGPWGWTWIDAAPWGFAPSHYGRWAFVVGRWGWAPGGFEARPVYAPALVGFIGGRFGVGWFPLGPGEMYWPGYTRNLGYIRAVNAAHVRDIDVAIGRGPRGFATARFVNRRFAVAVPRQVFVGAAAVGPAAVHVGAGVLAHARVASAPPYVRVPSLAARAAIAARAAQAANRAPLPPLHAAAPARPPVPVLHAPVQAFHAPAGVIGPPVQAFHGPGQIIRPPAPAFHAPVQVLRGGPGRVVPPPPRFGSGVPHVAGPPHPVVGIAVGVPRMAAPPHPPAPPHGVAPHVAAPPHGGGGPAGDDKHH